MKGRLLPAVALALLPTVVQAQNANARVTITVQGAAGLASEGITRFGTISNDVGRTVTIDPRAPLSDQSTALFTAQGGPNGIIIVNMDGTTDLCHEALGCGLRIVFASHVIGSPAPCCVAFSDFSNGSSARLNEQGNHYFRLGGSIQTMTNQPPGVYSGLFNLRISFQ